MRRNPLGVVSVTRFVPGHPRLLTGAAVADPADSLELGADIQAFRSITEAGLADEQRFEAYSRFVGDFPRSALAEVALARCLDLGGDVSHVLARLSVTDRGYLVASFQAHAEVLLANPSEGPAVTDASAKPAE
jgi:hypothetical protein